MWRRHFILGTTAGLMISPLMATRNAGATPTPADDLQAQVRTPDDIASSTNPARIDPMDPDELRDRFLAFRRRLYQDHDLGAVDTYLHRQFSSHSPMIPGQGREAYKRFVQTLYTGVPDLRPTQQHVLVEANELMAMTQWEATHTGTFLGVPATGKKLAFATADRYEIKEGLLFRHWDVVDRLRASVAIGLLREPA